MQIFIISCFAASGNVAFNQKKFGKLKSGTQLCASSLVIHLSRKAEGMAR
jgi:hypothetical protein